MAEPTAAVKATGRTFTPRFDADGGVAGLSVSAPHATSRTVTPTDLERLSQITEPAHPNGNAPVFAEAMARFDGSKPSTPAPDGGLKI